MSDTSLHKDCYQRILHTLCYFDIFEYPLTALELYRYQYVYGDFFSDKIFTLQNITATLDWALQNQDCAISQLEEFYFLRGQDAHVQTRKRRYVSSVKKYKKFLWKLRILSCFPFVQAIGVCNSIPLHNAHQDGDIDMFIVTHNKRIWTARFFMVSFLKLFKWRPTKQCKCDKLCPSFFINEQFLNLQAYQVHDDSYLRFWIASVLFVYSPHSIVEKWQQQNNWLRHFLPAYHTAQLTNQYSVTHNVFEQFVKKVFTSIASWFPEKFLKNFQLRTLPSHLAEQANRDSSVVVNDMMLKFHDKDRRKEYQVLFEERLRKYQ